MKRSKPAPRMPPSSQGLAPKCGVVWYTEDQWRLVKAAAKDPERFEETYSEWVAMAEETVMKMLAAGIAVERVPIIASELLAWCLARGKANDAGARAQYVSDLHARRAGRGA